AQPQRHRKVDAIVAATDVYRRGGQRALQPVFDVLLADGAGMHFGLLETEFGAEAEIRVLGEQAMPLRIGVAIDGGDDHPAAGARRGNAGELKQQLASHLAQPDDHGVDIVRARRQAPVGGITGQQAARDGTLADVESKSDPALPQGVGEMGGGDVAKFLVAEPHHEGQGWKLVGTLAAHLGDGAAHGHDRATDILRRDQGGCARHAGFSQRGRRRCVADDDVGAGLLDRQDGRAGLGRHDGDHRSTELFAVVSRQRHADVGRADQHDVLAAVRGAPGEESAAELPRERDRADKDRRGREDQPGKLGHDRCFAGATRRILQREELRGLHGAFEQEGTTRFVQSVPGEIDEMAEPEDGKPAHQDDLQHGPLCRGIQIPPDGGHAPSSHDDRCRRLEPIDTECDPERPRRIAFLYFGQSRSSPRSPQTMDDRPHSTTNLPFASAIWRLRRWRTGHSVVRLPKMAAPTLKLYIDYKSPYAYLAKDPAYRLETETGAAIDWLPYVL